MTRKTCCLFLSLALAFSASAEEEETPTATAEAEVTATATAETEVTATATAETEVTATATAAKKARRNPGHWSYGGGAGPAHWGDLSSEFTICKIGDAQSPVNLGRGAPADLRPLQLRYRTSALELVNTGRTVQVNLEPGSSLRFGYDEYELKRIQFHTPSEHQMYARALPMEIHFVHENRNGKLAVIAALARIGYRPHMILKRILEQLPMRPGETSNAGGKRFNPITLLPMKRDYLTYKGSVTTPPCTEGVRWIVFREPLRVTQKQVDKLNRAMGDNARPVQPLNKRKVSAFP